MASEPGKHVEVPEGVQRYRVVGGFMEATGDPQPDGGHWIQVSDLPAIYKHVCDRLLSDEALCAFEMHGRTISMAPPGAVELDELRGRMQAALQATSIPEVDRG